MADNRREVEEDEGNEALLKYRQEMNGVGNRYGNVSAEGASGETKTGRQPVRHDEQLGKAEAENGNDEEEDFEDDEEDIDEEDGEEEGDENGTELMQPRKRAKRERRNQFLDVEAVVDDDEDEDEDEDELVEEGFIREEEGLGDDELGDMGDLHHREFDRREREAKDRTIEASAEEIALDLKKRYGRSAARQYRGDASFIPQRMLLPDVNSPPLFAVKCKFGREVSVVWTLMRKKLALQATHNQLDFTAAFQRNSIKGYIFVEALRAVEVVRACRDIVNVYTSGNNIKLVPIKERPDLLRVTKQTFELLRGTYVRIKGSTKYVGDLAQVDNIDSSGTLARLRIVPRIDFSGKEDANFNEDNRKRKKQFNKAVRPPARLLSEKDAIKLGGSKNFSKRGPSHFILNGEEYEDGYLMKEFRIARLIIQGVNPSLSELTKFTAGSKEDEAIDLSSLAASIKASSTSQVFQPGDRVEVFEGEQAGLCGTVESIDNDIITIKPKLESFEGQTIEVPSTGLRKMFSLGDHVKVTNGKYKDDTGMVVKIENGQVTVLGDFTMTEIVVFPKDLTESSGSGNTDKRGQYELHDLIQLDVQTVACISKVEKDAIIAVDQNGTLRTLLPKQIMMKHPYRKSVATDREGVEISVGDTVREATGETKQGTILHIYRQYAFLYNKSITEDNGVFVSRPRNLKTIATKNQRGGLNLNKLNPSAGGKGLPITIPRTAGRDRAINQYVTIRQGPYKGLQGIVKDTTDATARVELHSNAKTVTIDKIKLGFKDPSRSGVFISYEEFLSSKRGGGYVNIGSVPFSSTPAPGSQWSSGRLATDRHVSGSRTPGWDAGGRTPGWDAGGRTPGWDAGGRTPGWDAGGGGRTPGWDTGGRTPGWDAGGRTPAWDAGGRTPGWEAGGKTPGWEAGGRTPGWDAGGRTPAWDAGGRTPAWDAGGPTPSYVATSTPGAWESGGKHPVWETGGR